MHLRHSETATTTLFAAPIIFDRNAHTVNPLVRVADILWSAAGISGLYRGSPIAPPTSVYTLPLVLVDRVGGWDSDAEAIGEDLHMFLKCFFALNGNLTCRTVLSPVSQSNVTGGGRGGIRGTTLDLRARYKQALRHMWGALDTGFALRKAIEMWQGRKYTARTLRPLHQSQGGHFDASSFECHETEDDTEPSNGRHPLNDLTNEVVEKPNWGRIIYLGHRLFEAHFLAAHIAIMVIASSLYVSVAEGSVGVNQLGWVFSVSSVLRIIGFIEMGCYFYLYEQYHKLCVNARERDMIEADLADGMCFSHRSFKQKLVDYLLVPFAAQLYGAIPLIEVETSHFWTLDLMYTVSKKVTRQPATSLTVADIV